MIISRRPWAGGWCPLFRDELVAILPPFHPEEGPVPLALFGREPYIDVYPGEETDNTRLFARWGITPRRWCSTGDSSAMYSMVEAGLGVCVNNRVNTRSWRGNVKILPLDPPQWVEIGIAYPERQQPAAERFLEYLRSHRDFPEAGA